MILSPYHCRRLRHRDCGIFPKASRTGTMSCSRHRHGHLEFIGRLRMSDVSNPTLDAIRITAERLCCEYP